MTIDIIKLSSVVKLYKRKKLVGNFSLSLVRIILPGSEQLNLALISIIKNKAK